MKRNRFRGMGILKNTLWKDWNWYYMPECLAKAREKLLEQPTCEHVRDSFTISEE